MQAIINKIKSYLYSFHPAIYLESQYEIYADKVVLELADSENRSVVEYANGAYYRYKNNIRIKLADKDLLAFLNEQEKEEREETFIIIKDFHRYFLGQDEKSASIVFAMKNFLYKIVKEDQSKKNTVFLISGTRAIPNEISKFISIFSLDSHSQPNTLGLLNDFLGERSRTLDNEIKEQISNKLKGLDEYEIEKILSLAFVETGTINKDSIKIISEHKSQMVKKNGILEMVDVKTKSDSLAGLENLKEWVKKKSEIFERLSEAKEIGIEPPKGVLLVGLPGCGKSLSAHAIADTMKVPLVRLDMGKLLGKYMGESEENIRRAISLAESVSPCVLWIDEIEKAFAGTGEGKEGSDVSIRILGSFLTWMQEKEKPVFVVATANKLDKLPPELSRKGRFDEIFSVVLPNEKERKQIFETHIRRRKQDINKIDTIRLAKETNDFSGAEIESVVKEALEEWFVQKRPFDTQLLSSKIKDVTPQAVSQNKKIDESMKEIKNLNARPASR